MGEPKGIGCVTTHFKFYLEIGERLYARLTLIIKEWRLSKVQFIWKAAFLEIAAWQEISMHIPKAKLAFSNPKHFWRENEISSSRLENVHRFLWNAEYTTIPWAPKFCMIVKHEPSEYRTSITWPFDAPCLPNIAHIWWNQRVTNAEMHSRVYEHDQLFPGKKNVAKPSSMVWSCTVVTWSTHAASHTVCHLCARLEHRPRMSGSS